MSVEFSEPEYVRAAPPPARSTSVGDWIIKMGLAKTPPQAQKVLLVLLVVCVVATIAVWSMSGGSIEKPPPGVFKGM